MTQTNPSSYCPNCPRAVLCIARNEEALPLATCVVCTKIFELEKAPISGFTPYRQTDPQGPVPPKRTVCPRSWIYFDLGYQKPFTCKKCAGRGVRYDGGSLWSWGRGS
jgi:hypothetical protein